MLACLIGENMRLARIAISTHLNTEREPDKDFELFSYQFVELS